MKMRQMKNRVPGDSLTCKLSPWKLFLEPFPFEYNSDTSKILPTGKYFANKCVRVNEEQSSIKMRIGSTAAKN